MTQGQKEQAGKVLDVVQKIVLFIVLGLIGWGVKSLQGLEVSVSVLSERVATAVNRLEKMDGLSQRIASMEASRFSMLDGQKIRTDIDDKIARIRQELTALRTDGQSWNDRIDTKIEDLRERLRALEQR